MKNEKIKKIINRALIFAGVCLVIIVAMDYIVMPLVVSSETISVPNVANKHKDEAIKILEAAGLNPVLQPPRFDAVTKRDFVILQRPVAGSLVKTGRRIYLAISGGDEKVLMPNLYGKTAKEAQMLIENQGLKVGFVEQGESEEAQNIVIAQQFVPNSSLDKGTAVNYTISIGPVEGMVRAPKLIGKSLKEAETDLENAGLKLGNVEYRYSQGLLPNTVLEQSPSEGSLIKQEGAVNLVVSSVKK